MIEKNGRIIGEGAAAIVVHIIEKIFHIILNLQYVFYKPLIHRVRTADDRKKLFFRTVDIHMFQITHHSFMIHHFGIDQDAVHIENYGFIHTYHILA